jgi:hypothetical protein
MANWVVDPIPDVPTGYTIVDSPLQSLLREEVFITGCYTLYNEDLAIVKM